MSIYTTAENRAALEKIGVEFDGCGDVKLRDSDGELTGWIDGEPALFYIRGAIATWLRRKGKQVVEVNRPVFSVFIVTGKAYTVKYAAHEECLQVAGNSELCGSIDEANMAAVHALLKEGE